MMFDLLLDVMNGFLAKIGSTVPLGRGYFPRHSRHFVPGSPGLQPWESKASRLSQAGSNHAACRFGHFGSPEGRKQNSPWASALGRRPERNRPERAAEGRSLFPKITFLESDSLTEKAPYPFCHAKPRTP